MSPIYLPDRQRAVPALPQDVGLVVAIEIARAGDLPLATNCPDDTAFLQLVIFYLPDRHGAVGTVPQQVAGAIPIVVAGALEAPLRPERPDDRRRRNLRPVHVP